MVETDFLVLQEKFENSNEADYPQLLAEIDEILKAEPNNLQAMFLKGLVLYENEQYFGCVKCCNKLLETESGNIDVLRLKMKALHYANKVDECYERCKRVLKLKPEDRTAKFIKKSIDSYRGGMSLFVWGLVLALLILEVGVNFFPALQEFAFLINSICIPMISFMVVIKLLDTIREIRKNKHNSL